MTIILKNYLHNVRKSDIFASFLNGQETTIQYERFELIMLFSNFGWRFGIMLLIKR